jgi:hypothetical protein
LGLIREQSCLEDVLAADATGRDLARDVIDPLQRAGAIRQ